MGACRQTYSIWFHLRKVCKPFSKHWGRWNGFKDLLSLDVGNRYFWHDSFGRYLNQWLVCLLIGHRNVKWLNDGSCDNERPKWHCFNCQQEIDPGIDRVRDTINA